MATIVKNGLDWSAGTIDGKILRDNGWEFACRYLALDWRGLRQKEVDTFRANDVGIVLIAEYDTIDDHNHQSSAMLGGAVNGLVQAKYADDLRMRLGLPEQPIYFTLDVQPGSVPWSFVEAYLRAAASALGGTHRIGLYAGYDGIQFAYERKLADFLWQTYAWSYDTHGNPKLHPQAVLYQYDIYGESLASVDVDLNKAFAENYGQTQMFESVDPPPPTWLIPVHPDWFAASLSERYPSVGRWDYEGQKLVLDTIRHNALIVRRTWQYVGPSTESGHSGPILEVGAKVNVERITDITEVRHGKEIRRTWVITGKGTWIPEDTLNLDFTIVRKKPRPIVNM